MFEHLIETEGVVGYFTVTSAVARSPGHRKGSRLDGEEDWSLDMAHISEGH